MPVMRKRYIWKNHIKNKQIQGKWKGLMWKWHSKTAKLEYVTDLQSVVQTPCGKLSVFYYKMRLNIYNFTIFDNAPMDGYCYLWNDASGNKGAIEIASCFLYFNSDNCCAQKKNQFSATTYLFDTQTSQKVESITHKYFVVGHTQNDGDSIHSCIEKQNKEL
ncbi:hypothetical protein PR048_004787 [Dryococelus australis]|uniref:DUF7869 domain-containing protein n=1 Tax=Dryococelus australis TaxID=614101 RepID=A0ABQ9I6V2_9NEOP|nr:hypothetical protein PR048_004787 [Dryococelus australis]